MGRNIRRILYARQKTKIWKLRRVKKGDVVEKEHFAIGVRLR